MTSGIARSESCAGASKEPILARCGRPSLRTLHGAPARRRCVLPPSSRPGSSPEAGLPRAPPSSPIPGPVVATSSCRSATCVDALFFCTTRRSVESGGGAASREERSVEKTSRTPGQSSPVRCQTQPSVWRRSVPVEASAPSSSSARWSGLQHAFATTYEISTSTRTDARSDADASSRPSPPPACPATAGSERNSEARSRAVV